VTTGGRRLVSSLFVAACTLAVVAALVPLAFILFFVISQGVQALTFDFFTQMAEARRRDRGGMANAIVGTLMLTGLAALMAIPIGVVSASIYQSTRPRASVVVRFASDTLNGVPSIVIGVFAYGLAVLPFRQFSALAGGLALGIMMIPDHRSHDGGVAPSRARSMREGALALGATRARAVFTVVGTGCAAWYRHRHRPGAGQGCRRDGPAPVHVVQQSLLHDQSHRAGVIHHRAGVYVRHLAIRRLAPAGVGWRWCWCSSSWPVRFSRVWPRTA